MSTEKLPMTIQEKMQMAATELKERLARGEQISKEDRKFLDSYLNVSGGKNPRSGKQSMKTRSKHGH